MTDDINVSIPQLESLVSHASKNKNRLIVFSLHQEITLVSPRITMLLLDSLFSGALFLTATLVNAIPSPKPATANSILAEYVILHT